jgi:hypothetical protein
MKVTLKKCGNLILVRFASNKLGVELGKGMVAMEALDGMRAGVAARALLWCVQIQEISAC